MQEKRAVRLPGLVMLVVLLATVAVAAGAVASGVTAEPGVVRPRPLPMTLGSMVLVIAGVAFSGFTIVQPNESKVVTLFGRYLGTIRRNGWGWTWPLTNRETISLRVQNFDSETLKVNDAVGNPVEVAAVIVWRVVETAKASFEVEDYQDFVRIQTETAVRHMASEYPYDTFEGTEHTLRANADEVTASLHAELQEHLEQAGVEVLRTQLRRLAYAPEIAGDMLRRQQAEAVVAARYRIVEGAVGMVEHALRELSRQGVVELDEERRAQMVANLLVVLCSEHHAQPVVNMGSLYQ
jgi:regulator of protease activity HflC (stomatin/prohibitin superfamily)